MTLAIAVVVNVTPPSAPCGPASAGNSSSDGHSPSAFSTPLQQARQQQSAQRSSTSNPTASTANTSTATSSSTASTTTSTVTGKSWNPAGDNAKDDDKQATSTGPNPPADAAAAMLALLGQSIPANAAPTPATPAGGSPERAAATGAAATATAMQVSGMPGMPMSAAESSAQPDTDDAEDAPKATDGLKDNALSALLGDADDDTTPAGTMSPGSDAKFVNVSQATATTSTPSDKSDPLDALRNLITPFGQAQASIQAVATPHAMTMNASAGTPSFAQELGQHVAWLGGQDIKEARITLHPEDLGQLDVKVSVQHDHVDVSFIAQHPNAVHAVQQTLSQLDSMLAQHGLTLGQAQVGQGNHGGSAGQGTSPSSAAAGEAGATDEGDVAQVAAPVVQALGLLDTFA